MIGLRLRALFAVTVASVIYFAVDTIAGVMTLAGIAVAVEIELRLLRP